MILSALLAVTGSVWAQDAGVPDTLYVETDPQDQCLFGAPPHFVRFPILVTSDIPDPATDSVAGMGEFPFCFTSSNPASNARIEGAYNNTNVYAFPGLNNSIFRHLPSMEFPQDRNWLMDMSEQGTGVEWDIRILDIGGGPHF